MGLVGMGRGVGCTGNFIGGVHTLSYQRSPSHPSVCVNAPLGLSVLCRPILQYTKIRILQLADVECSGDGITSSVQTHVLAIVHSQLHADHVTPSACLSTVDNFPGNQRRFFSSSHQRLATLGCSCLHVCPSCLSSALWQNG